MALKQSPIDFDRVNNAFASAHEKYVTAKPFPHASFTDLFNLDVLRQVEAEFPQPGAMGGSFTGEIEGGKFTESEFANLGPATQAFVAAANSGTFCSLLSELTGIQGLISDPYLTGGGLHQTATGGRLKVHSDFNVHPFLKLTRQLNMIVYLNDEWDEDWGGRLELWNEDMTQAEVAIAPHIGNFAIFTCSDISFHGLPDPLTCPPNRFRRSIAFYYFTAEATTPEPRSTMWKERPGENFMSRPSARFKRAGGHAYRAAKTLFER